MLESTAQALRILQEAGSLDEELRRQLLALALAPTPARKMTYDEFLAWAGEDTLAEWVDGEVVTASPASKQHQRIAGFWLETGWLWGSTLPSPFRALAQIVGADPSTAEAFEGLIRGQEP